MSDDLNFWHSSLEERFLWGMSASARLLLVCHCECEAGNSILSARKATKCEARLYGVKAMKAGIFLISLILLVFSPPLYCQNLAIPSNTIPHTQTTGLSKDKISQVFESAYGNLSQKDVASGEFHLVRHESDARRLTKGKLVLIQSPIGKIVYSAVTVKGSGTVLEVIGFLRYENFNWNIYHLATTGDEYISGDNTIIKIDKLSHPARLDRRGCL